MYEVSIEGWFAAAHQLRLADGSLEPLHGHNWRVTVTCAGSLNQLDLLIDFTRLRPRLDGVLAALHDRHLNELEAFAERNPSAERVAEYIAAAMGTDLPPGVRLRAVAVEESPGCIARYIPEQASDKH